MRAIIPAYAERTADIEHVAATCRAAGVEPLLVLQACPPITGPYDALMMTAPAGKGGAVRAGLQALLTTGSNLADPVLVVDGDLHRLDAGTVAAFASAAGNGWVARPRFHNGAGRVGRRLADVLDALLVDYPAGLDDGGLLGPIQGYPHGRHLLDSTETGMAFDLDVLFRHVAAGDRVTTLEAGERVHRPGTPDHLTRTLRAHLDYAAGLVEW